MKMYTRAVLICACLMSSVSYATEQSFQTFNKLFSAWTEAFNHQKLKASCDLFAKNVVADYRGVPQKNYNVICDGFKKVFADTQHRYHYSYKLHHVYQSGDLAAIRITWYLKLYENEKLISTTQDEGIDIFQRNQHGQWQIVNYIGYSVDNIKNQV